jgi:hypothetical protein
VASITLLGFDCATERTPHPVKFELTDSGRAAGLRSCRCGYCSRHDPQECRGHTCNALIG